MPVTIVRNDITNMKADAIVNTANPQPTVGSGTDAAIHAKAGPGLLEARKKIGKIRTGCSAITPAFGLDAKYVIHTAGPVWRGGFLGEAKQLRRCYDSALALALENGCRSIAFPLISTGNYRFPKDKALNIAMQAFDEFLLNHPMEITLAIFDQDALKLSEKLFSSISSYIDDNYVEEKVREEYEQFEMSQMQSWQDRFDWTASLPLDEVWANDGTSFDEPPAWSSRSMEPCPPSPREESCSYGQAPCPPSPVERAAAPMQAPSPARKQVAEKTKKAPAPVLRPKPLSLKQMLEETDAGFSETLLKLIDKTGKKDSEIYNKANVSRQHFSKIRNNPNYKPTKPTAIAFAVALELDMEQTRDLIGRAGYALTRSSKFDVIIMYFIEQHNYNMYDINAALYEFDQSLLGA